ncbi:MAG: D-glycerate dehydrogenase [Acidobacteria bacterium]|nr:D-glycerate dehydrogenase [Acidobacteriota bacterium]
MTRIVVTGQIPKAGIAILRKEGEVVVIPTSSRNESDLIELLRDADAAITMLSDPMTSRVLRACPRLKIVANYAVGTNNIDVAAARRCGIHVTNTPGVLTDATADLTLALILAVTRRVVEGDRFVRAGKFEGWDPGLMLGISLQGKRLGVIGMGRIGQAVVARAIAFGMEAVYHTRSFDQTTSLELGAARVPFEELMATSHVVTIHTPLTAETKGMIGTEALALMRRGSFIVNTSRGAVVDEDALAHALETGHLRGAGLDVFENEPTVNPRLLRLPNVVLAPHIGSATDETRNEMARKVARDVCLALRGETPKHLVAGTRTARIPRKKPQ